MNWSVIDMKGFTGISRVVGLFEVRDFRGIPWTKYKIKVLERGAEDFIALANVCVKDSNGSPDWTCGLGPTGEIALQDLLTQMDAILKSRTNWQEEDFEWSDPHDF